MHQAVKALTDDFLLCDLGYVEIFLNHVVCYFSGTCSC